MAVGDTDPDRARAHQWASALKMAAGMNMQLSKDELNLKVVRRMATGAAPDGWELHSGDVITPIHVSPARFRSMEAAFKAGQAGLTEHVAARQSVRRNRPLPRAMAASLAAFRQAWPGRRAG